MSASKNRRSNTPILWLLLLCISLNSCHRQQIQQPIASKTDAQPIGKAQFTSVSPQAAASFRANSPITSIFQDRAGIYWFGTDREGIYRYDGKSITQLNAQMGLCYNQVRKIEEDQAGNIWIATANGVSRYDGKTFTTFPMAEDANLNGHFEKQWKKEADDLWFPVGGGVYREHSVLAPMTGTNSFTYLPLPSTEQQINYSESPSDPVSPFTVYSTFKDRQGNLWLGTQSLGVCRYDGNNFIWISGLGLDGPAVLAIFQDHTGNMWFGNNGAGVFRYDGKTLTNFTEENGLGNPEFLKASNISAKPGPGALARFYSIAEDNEGNMWLGTIDAGVWRYDGKDLTNFTLRDGLDHDAIECIYLDQKANLLIGTDGGGFYKFDGKTFVPFSQE